MKIALLLVLAIAVVHDLRERRIPNYLIAGSLPVILAFAAGSHGAGGLGACLVGMLAGMALFFPFFATGFVGAGDVKLFGVVGGFVGLDALLAVWLYTLMAGGVLAVIAVLAGRSLPRFAENMKLALIALAYRVEGSTVPLKDMASQTAARVPYALAIAAGTLIWMVRES